MHSQLCEMAYRAAAASESDAAAYARTVPLTTWFALLFSTWRCDGGQRSRADGEAAAFRAGCADIHSAVVLE